MYQTCPQDVNSEAGQVYSVCILQFSCFTYKYNTTVWSQNIKQTKWDHNRRRNSYRIQITAFSVGITIINQRIIWKDDIEFVTEFPCYWDTLYKLGSILTDILYTPRWRSSTCVYYHYFIRLFTSVLRVQQ